MHNPVILRKKESRHRKYRHIPNAEIRNTYLYVQEKSAVFATFSRDANMDLRLLFEGTLLPYVR